MCSSFWPDVFQFTLYWSLSFYTPIFFLCGSYAFWNLNFPSPPPPPPQLKDPSISYHDTTSGHDGNAYLLAPVGIHPPPTPSPTTAETTTPLRRAPTTIPTAQLLKENKRGSRLVFALLVFFTFMTVGIAGSVLGSAVLGFSVYGLYLSGNFNMSM